MRSIVGQQLSTNAARAIYARLTDRFGGRTPTPAEVLADDPDELRASAGLSHAKVAYLRSLAEHVLDGSLDLDRLDSLPDDEVIAELMAVKGIGEWSAQMFLMFHLDVPTCWRSATSESAVRVMIRYGLPSSRPRRDGADRRAVAAVSDAGVSVSVALVDGRRRCRPGGSSSTPHPRRACL